MAVLSTEDFKKVLHKIASYSTDDDNIKIIEDLTDTFSAVDRVGEYEAKIEELTRKVSDTDKAWRDRYASRFYDGEELRKAEPEKSGEVTDAEQDRAETVTIDELFTEIA